jgi:transposase
VNRDGLWMRATERKRLYIIRQVLERKITQRKAGELLDLSLRQIKRLCGRVKREGDGGIIHRNRNRRSNHSINELIKNKVVDLARRKYRGFGPTLITEQLRKKEGIEVSDETIRQWLIAAGVTYTKRRARPHRRWRQRKAHFGEMLQMDGSHHDWLEGRGQRMVLMGYVDDATGRAFARFYEYEGTLPAFDGLNEYFRRYGMPCSVYLDKHSTYKGLRKISVIDQLEGEAGVSQFERAMKELGIQVIHANSPQAKGRIERFFRTLQDRLVKEMRVAGIKTIGQANSYLDGYLSEHNKKFSIAPQQPTDLHRPVPKEISLECILSVQTRKFIRNDFTIFHAGKVFQLQKKTRSRYITAQERMDGSFHLINGKTSFAYTEIQRSNLQASCEEKEPGPGKGNHNRVPKGLDHPWRSFKFGHQHSEKQKGDISTLVKR